ncbi:hypothetical protein NL676_005348 [Syzygium grande]|nr:hypothetical protein NL676_005348 [Syzygium grande]
MRNEKDDKMPNVRLRNEAPTTVDGGPPRELAVRRLLPSFLFALFRFRLTWRLLRVRDGCLPLSPLSSRRISPLFPLFFDFAPVFSASPFYGGRGNITRTLDLDENDVRCVSVEKRPVDYRFPSPTHPKRTGSEAGQLVRNPN